jgi:hypothetical protein
MIPKVIDAREEKTGSRWRSDLLPVGIAAVEIRMWASSRARSSIETYLEALSPGTLKLRVMS